MKTRTIAAAKVKTDKIDARVLAQFGAADFIANVWVPDEETRELRRRVAHRAALVSQRTRLRNQVHALLARNLVPVPAITDLFGRSGRHFLDGVEPAEYEREQMERFLRLHDLLCGEIVDAEQALLSHALQRDELRYLEVFVTTTCDTVGKAERRAGMDSRSPFTAT